jgi:hypothetical protein
MQRPGVKNRLKRLQSSAEIEKVEWDGKKSRGNGLFAIDDGFCGLGRLGGGVCSQIRTRLRTKLWDLRELTGQIRKFRPLFAGRRMISPRLTGLSDENSRATSREFFRGLRENTSASREDKSQHRGLPL